MTMTNRQITQTRQADDNHVVHTIEGGSETGPAKYVAKPCVQCPWRKENDGSFPAEAFAHSAETAYDMASHVFACHMTGTERTKTCAGGVLGSPHNLTLRLAGFRGDLNHVHDGGADLHEDYRSMAVANGMDPDDERLKPCR